MQYKLSAHAYKRFKERVNAKRSKKQAEMWVQHAIEHSVLLEHTHEGKEVRRYKGYKIVIGDNGTVVSIIHYNSRDFADLKHDIRRKLINQFRRELKPYLSAHRDLTIRIHESEIRKLRVNNPATKEHIKKTIRDYTTQARTIELAIMDLYKLAEYYRIDRQELPKIDY